MLLATGAIALFLATVPLSEDFPPVLPGSVSPELAGTPDGTLWLSWIEPSPGPTPGELELHLSRRKGGVWSEPVVVARGAKLIVNDADMPQVAPLADGSIVVQWLERGEGGTSVLRVARSRDGKTFAPPVSLGKPARGERGFARFVSAGGSFRAMWLDEGKLLSAPWVEGGFGEASVLDGRVCECCQIAAASANTNTALVAYRDRSADEIRDISVVRHSGVTWEEPVAVGPDEWKTAACPVNGPAIDVSDRTVATAWFTAAHGEARVLVAFSRDEGRTFGKPIRLDAGTPAGRVAVRWADASHVIVTWVEQGDDDGALWAAWAKPDGTAGEAGMIASFRGGNSASHPRLARAGKELLVAWSDGRGDKQSPKLVRVSKLGRADLTRKRKKPVSESAAAAVQAPPEAAPPEAVRVDAAGPSPRTGTRNGDLAPEIDGRDLDGKPVRLSDYRGKVVLVSFWGAWCGPCREEIPEHVEMREALREKGFEILSVNSGDKTETARAFAREHGIRYPVVLDTGISGRWRVNGFPTNLVIDRTGHVRHRAQGYSPRGVANQRAVVEELLAEPAPAAPAP